jgi:hypothetical protein
MRFSALLTKPGTTKPRTAGCHFLPLHGQDGGQYTNGFALDVDLVERRKQWNSLEWAEVVVAVSEATRRRRYDTGWQCKWQEPTLTRPGQQPRTAGYIAAHMTKAESVRPIRAADVRKDFEKVACTQEGFTRYAIVAALAEQDVAKTLLVTSSSAPIQQEYDETTTSVRSWGVGEATVCTAGKRGRLWPWVLRLRPAIPELLAGVPRREYGEAVMLQPVSRNSSRLPLGISKKL